MQLASSKLKPVFVAQLFVALLMLLICIPTTATAQSLAGGKATTKFVPKNAVVCATIFPKQIGDDEKLDFVPREIVTAWGLTEVGIDPMKVKQISVVVDNLPMPPTGPPMWAAVLHLGKDQTLGGKMTDRMQQTTIGGKTAFSGVGIGMPSFIVVDESTILVGDEPFLPALLDANGKGQLVDLMKVSDINGQFQSFVDIKSLRPLIEMAMANLPPLPPPIAKLRTVPKKVDSLQFGVNFDGHVHAKVVMDTESGEDAEDVATTLKDGMEFGLEMGLTMMEAQMANGGGDVEFAWVDYADRIGNIYKDAWTPKVSGKKVTLYFEDEAAIVPFLIGGILPAAQQVRGAARRTQSMNNVRQMSLACLNYESAYMRFPKQATYDDRGKPLLSWRVQILPFIEQQELYDKFHHDEPWDSPHNKKLIKEMPMVYMSPDVGDLGGKTVYLGVSGEGRIFNGDNEVGFASITDGSSNTALMVEVNPEEAVPWTKPADYEFDPKQPMKGLGGLRPEGFIVNVADGSVHTVSRDIDPEVWEKFQTMNDGEIFNWDDLNR